MIDPHSPQTQAASAAAAWSGVGLAKYLEFVGVHAWSDVAAMAATLYTVLLIVNWIRKEWRGRK